MAKTPYEELHDAIASLAPSYEKDATASGSFIDAMSEESGNLWSTEEQVRKHREDVIDTTIIRILVYIEKKEDELRKKERTSEEMMQALAFEAML